MCELQQAVETLVGFMTGPQPRVGAGPHAQRQAPPFPSVEVFTQEFLNLKPPTFLGNLVKGSTTVYKQGGQSHQNIKMLHYKSC